MDPQRLEDRFGRVHRLVLVSSAGRDEIREFPGRFRRPRAPLPPSQAHGIGHALRSVWVRWVAVGAEDADELLARGLPEEVARRRPLREVKTQVQRAVLLRTEAPRRLVQLRRGDTEVQKNACDGAQSDTNLRQYAGHRLESTVVDAKPLVLLLERFAYFHCLRIQVKGVQGALRAQRLQNQSAVPPSSERAVDKNAISVLRHDCSNDLLSHGRRVRTHSLDGPCNAADSGSMSSSPSHLLRHGDLYISLVVHHAVPGTSSDCT
mmetsp:Transcript_42993/g.138189  ORF Transcript_42993/g.138189 Transcript_42993/m.138189 type:complete len:264 (-) Transcript_42993:236-1027(-)